MVDKVRVNIVSGTYTAKDVARALEAMFNALYKSFSEHASIDKLNNPKTITVTICETLSGMCAEAKIMVDGNMWDSTIEELVNKIIDKLLSLAPWLSL